VKGVSERSASGTDGSWKEGGSKEKRRAAKIQPRKHNQPTPPPKGRLQNYIPLLLDLPKKKNLGEPLQRGRGKRKTRESFSMRTRILELPS